MTSQATRGSGWRKGVQAKLKKRGAWLLAPIFVLSVVSSAFPTKTSATVEAGLNVTVYDNWTGQGNAYNNAPPIPPTTPVCLETTAPNINWNFDQIPVCGIYEDFVVKFEGFITAPETGTYTFYMHADDGTRLFFGNQMVENYWRDTGNGGQIFTYTLNAGESIPLLGWYYENGGGSWVKLEYQVNNSWTPVPAAWFTKTAITPTTIVAPYLNSPRNLTVTSTNESKVYLSWDAPEASNTDVERYAIFFSKDNFASGWAIPSTQTSAVVENLDPSTEYQFKVRADNDSIPVYSGWSNQVTGITDAPPIRYSLDNAVWDTANEGSTLTLSSPNGGIFTDVLFASYGTPTGSNGLYRTSQCDSPSSIQEVTAAFIGKTSASISADNGVFGDPCGGTYKHLTVVLKYAPAPPTTTTTIAPAVTWPKIITTTTTEAPVATTTTTTPPETTTTSSSTTTTSTTSTTTTTSSTTTTVPRVEVKLPVPEASEIAKIETKEELVKLVKTVDLKSIEPDQVVALVSNSAFIELPKEQLAEVFQSVNVQELSPEQEAQFVEALTNAPDDVKAELETAVDIYGEGLDDYVPVGSEVDVATRRSLIAVTTVLSTVTAVGAAPGAGGGPSGGNGSGGSGGSPSDSNKAARREEEQEDEEAGGLEGPEDREKNTNTKNSIYNYKADGTKEFSIMGFIKKFLKETAALSFTFAGSAIMFVTLSGDTRRIAIIATVAAVFVHYVHVMLENDEE